jgi:hypothetical protein
MKYSGFSILSFLIILSCKETRSKENKIQLMDDPLIGLSYDPKKVLFDSCPRFMDKREAVVKGSQWIFARCVQPHDTIYITSCLMKNWDDQDGKWVDSILEPDFGVVVRVAGTKIKDIGTPEGLFGKVSMLPSNEVSCLMEDAVIRYTKAFGGSEKLQKTISDKGITADILPGVLIEKLKAGGISIPSGPLPKRQKSP